MTKQTVKEIKQAFKDRGVVMQSLVGDECFLGSLIYIAKKCTKIVATKMLRSVDTTGGLKAQHDCVLWIIEMDVELSY